MSGADNEHIENSRRDGKEGQCGNGGSDRHGDIKDINRHQGPYELYIKRPLDILCALAALIVFSWLYLILIILGVIFMRGNPFFTQDRPGKDEKIFKLIKFRTMDNRKDENGNLLPDEVRLNRYGRFLRSSSLDELPEALNILKGDMSVIGPRPLLVEYLPLYSDVQRHRHDVRPGLSGYAQVNGRNSITWTHKFELDCGYVQSITFLGDLKILFQTVEKAFIKREGISSDTSDTMEDFDGTN
jgi:undecaprenyl phosphate N,N'-diacetylbacillosamine 1-phosphate transferase